MFFMNGQLYLKDIAKNMFYCLVLLIQHYVLALSHLTHYHDMETCLSILQIAKLLFLRLVLYCLQWLIIKSIYQLYFINLSYNFLIEKIRFTFIVLVLFQH